MRAARRCSESRRPLPAPPSSRRAPGPGRQAGPGWRGERPSPRDGQGRAACAAQWQRRPGVGADGGSAPAARGGRPVRESLRRARRGCGGELAAPEQSRTWGRGRGGGAGAPLAAHAQLGNGSGGKRGGGRGGTGGRARVGGALGECPAEALCAPSPPGGGGAGPRGGGSAAGCERVPGPSAWAFVRRRGGGGGPFSSPSPPRTQFSAEVRDLPRLPGRRTGGSGRAPRRRSGAASFITKSARRRQLRALGGAMLLGRGRRRGTWRRLRAEADCSLLGPEPRVGSGGPGSRFPSPLRGPFPARAAPGRGRARPFCVRPGCGARRGPGGRGGAVTP